MAKITCFTTEQDAAEAGQPLFCIGCAEGQFPEGNRQEPIGERGIQREPGEFLHGILASPTPTRGYRRAPVG